MGCIYVGLYSDLSKIHAKPNPGLAFLSQLQWAHLWVLLYKTCISDRFASTKGFKGALEHLAIIGTVKFGFADF